MKKYISVFIIIISCSTVSIGQSDDAYTKTLKKMFEVSGSEETFHAAIKQMFKGFKQNYANVNEDIWKDFEKEFLNASLNDLVEMLVPVYTKYLSQAELEELIKFYKTPLGKKYALNTPFIVQESMQIGQQWGVGVAEKFQKKMKDKGY